MKKDIYYYAWLRWFYDRIYKDKMKPLLFTTTPDGRPLLGRANISPDIAFADSNDLYKRFCNALVGSNWNRSSKLDSLPLSVTWLDYPGTKNFSPNRYELPHTHSIVLVPPALEDRLTEALDRQRSLCKTQLKLSDNIIPIELKSSDIANTVSYASKYNSIETYNTLTYNGDNTLINPLHSSEKIIKTLHKNI